MAQSLKQHQHVTAFKFLHSINLVAYAVSGKGLVIDMIAQSNLPQVGFLHAAEFGDLGDTILEIDEIFNVRDKEFYLVARCETRLVVVYDVRQGEYSKLKVVDSQKFKISNGRDVQNSVCQQTKRYFFSDGPKIYSICPEDQGKTLNF